MKPLVYIETTVPSYHCDTRVALQADIARTREWWERERTGYECFISAVVVDELSQGDYPTKDCCLRLVADLAVLELNEDIIRIAEVY